MTIMTLTRIIFCTFQTFINLYLPIKINYNMHNVILLYLNLNECNCTCKKLQQVILYFTMKNYDFLHFRLVRLNESKSLTTRVGTFYILYLVLVKCHKFRILKIKKLLSYMQKYNTKIKKNTKQVRLRDFYIYTHRNSIITMGMKKKKISNGL